jgi:hypothetical protein
LHLTNKGIAMSKMFQVYGIGQALIPVLPPPLPFQSAPTSNQTNYEIGQVVFTPPTSPTAFYMYGGGGNWVQLADADGPIESVVGTANQVDVTTVANVATVSLIGPYTPATYAAHGVLIGEGTSSIVATATGSAGQLLTSGGASADPTWTTATFPATATSTGTILRSNGTNWVASTDTYPDTSTAGALIAATATNVIGEIADVATGQVLMSGGVGVIPAYSDSPSVSGSLTAGTTVTATSGNITASAGNLVAAGAGNGVSLPVTTGSGDASGTVNCNGRTGSVTFTSVSVANNADITLTMGNTSITGASTRCVWSLSGATTNSALTVKSYTPSANQVVWVVTNGGTATSTADITFDFIVLN